MKIIREFTVRVKVYDNGHIETKEVFDKDEFTNILLDCSEKTRQSLLVIMQVSTLRKQYIAQNKQIDYSQLTKDAITLVAQNLRVSRSTVQDKLTRKINRNTNDVTALIEDYFTSKNQDIRKVLLDSIKGSIKEADDERAIEEFFNKSWI